MEDIIKNIDSAIDAGKSKARRNRPNTHIIVYKDGSHLYCPKENCWEYENDPDWLVTIEPETDSNDIPTKTPNLMIGRFELYDSDFTPGDIWIENGGEGAEFDQKLLEEHIAEFYRKYF